MANVVQLSSVQRAKPQYPPGMICHSPITTSRFSQDRDHKHGKERPSNVCKAKFQRSKRSLAAHGDDQANSIASRRTENLQVQLRNIGGISPDRMLLAKKIQHLHFDSANALSAHCGAYGAVEHVLVAHSKVMSACKTYVRRLRPASLAVVVMADAASAEAVLRWGHEHIVAGKTIVLAKFERQEADMIDDGASSRGESLNSSAASCIPDVASTCDGASTYDTVSVGEDSSEDCFVSADFEYWATDDEWF